MAEYHCVNCGAEMNAGEGSTFTVCTPCWNRNYKRKDPPPAPEGELKRLVEKWRDHAKICDANGFHKQAESIDCMADELEAVLNSEAWNRREGI